MTDERFDAFISYQRARTGELATALQPALERFAKPWYRLRASRVFRDDASMSANAALWSTIQVGLEQSGWLVLLASPEAAASEYVANEIAWWVEHKSAERILLVLAVGELHWDRAGGRFDVDRSTALPAGLVSAYTEEPRWIDMRWFLEEGSQQTADPRFEERVVDLVATIRGTARDQLIGENVRQHRRVRRLTRAAVTSLSVLLVASLVAGAIAIAQSAEASAQRDVAEDEARIATARQLAATSQSLADSDLVLSRLLADQAFRMNDDPLTRAALLQAASVNPQQVATLDVAGGVSALAVSSGGETIAVGTGDGDVLTWAPGSDAPVAVGRLPGAVTALALDDSGSVVVASSGGEYSYPATGASEWMPATVRSWVEGAEIVLPDGAQAPLAVSPDGGAVAYAMASAAPGVVDGFGFLDTATGAADVSPFAGSWVSALSLPGDGTIVLEEGAGLGMLQPVRREIPSLTEIERGDAGAFHLRLGGGELSSGAAWGVTTDANGTMEVAESFGDTSARFAYVGTATSGLAVSGDGTRAAASDTGVITIFETAVDGGEPRELVRLAGSREAGALAFLPDARLVSSGGGRIVVWDPEATSRLARTTPTYVRDLSNASPAPRVEVSPDGVSAVVQESDFTSTWHHLESGTTQSIPMAFVAWRDDASAYFLSDADGLVLITDSSTEMSRTPVVLPGAPEYGLFVDGGGYDADADSAVVIVNRALLAIDVETGQGEQVAEDVVAVSADGALYAKRVGDLVSVVDRATEAVRWEVEVSPTARVRFEGADVVVSAGRATLYAGADGVEIAAFDEPSHIPAAVDAEQDILARYRTDGMLSVSSLRTGLVLGEFAFVHGSTSRPGIAFSADGSELLVLEAATYGDSALTVIDLDPSVWTEVVCEGAGRDLTGPEWRRLVGTDPPSDLTCGG